MLKVETLRHLGTTDAIELSNFSTLRDLGLTALCLSKIWTNAKATERSVVRSQNEQTNISIYPNGSTSNYLGTEAHRFMKVAKELPNVDMFTHLGNKALYLISTLPEVEKESKKRCSPNSGPHLKKIFKEQLTKKLFRIIQQILSYESLH